MGTRSIAGSKLNIPSRYCSACPNAQSPAANSQNRPRTKAIRRISGGCLALSSLVMASVAMRRTVAGRTVLEIDGLGLELAAKLVDDEFVTNLAEVQRQVHLDAQAEGGQPELAAVRQVGVNRHTVRLWRQRFRERGMARLEDASGRGRKPVLASKVKEANRHVGMAFAPFPSTAWHPSGTVSVVRNLEIGAPVTKGTALQSTFVAH